MTKQNRKQPAEQKNRKEAFEPNKMTFAISALAAVALTLLAVMAMFS